MKYLKMLGLAAVAAMALMAFGAGTASATKLYSGGTALGVGTELSSSLNTGTSAELNDTSGFLQNTCTSSSVNGKIENAGSSTTTVSGEVKSSGLSFTNCTYTTTVLAGGTLEIHHINKSDNGTVTAAGFEVAIHGPSGECVYSAGAGVTLGTLTGTTDTSKHATLNINTVVDEVSERFFCPNDATWKANYTVTSPTGLNVRAS